MTDLSSGSEQILSISRGREDSDPEETAEWLEALDAVTEHVGRDRAQYLYDRLAEHALSLGIESSRARVTPYINTIPVAEQPRYPGNLEIEERLAAALRWNALAMVVRANKAYGELGGHIASYASAADLFEVGFNHFFRAAAPDAGEGTGGDLVYFQPHSSPGVYARAFLEGFLSEEHLQHYRQEIAGPGLCSYPHPWLMPDFWQFPTGSMGIGPINSIYQARFMRYLQNRGLAKTQDRKVWGFFGDGEMDEPESIGALSLAAREQLDNLVFVINCNLQRLDGPVRSNGRIIDELEAQFIGAGWNVIKVLWGSDWDALFARDQTNALLRAFAHTVDGQFQTFSANDGGYNRERFFGQNPELAALASHLSDEDIDGLRRGGHDVRKLHAAYAKALSHRGQPTVILAKTMKGFGMGTSGQGRMTTHQQKKLGFDDLKAFRDRFRLPLSDADVEAVKFYKPAENSPEMQYLHARRAGLGGYLPRRRRVASKGLIVPPMYYLGPIRNRCGRQGDVDDHGDRAHVRHADEGRNARPARGAGGRRRGAYVRHGEHVPAGRHLFAARAVVRAGRSRLHAVLPRGHQGADSRRGHFGSGRDVVMDRGGDVVQRARSAHAAVLHLLLDVRLPAHWRHHLGGGGPARTRLPDRRDRGQDDARRRRAAASGWQQPSGGIDDTELPCIRSRVCV